MERETIEYRGVKYHRYPESKRRHLRVYYWSHTKWKQTPHSLHRKIWIDKNGKIPEGFVVHHIDGDSLNNDIGNLECMEKGKHQSMHALEPERVKKSRESIKKAILKAPEWHRSKEGREWHKKHAQGSLIKPRTIKCLFCRKNKKVRNVRARFCSKNCCVKQYRRDKKAALL